MTDDTCWLRVKYPTSVVVGNKHKLFGSYIRSRTISLHAGTSLLDAALIDLKCVLVMLSRTRAHVLFLITIGWEGLNLNVLVDLKSLFGIPQLF